LGVIITSDRSGACLTPVHLTPVQVSAAARPGKDK
jgi:hypothetical protein